MRGLTRLPAGDASSILARGAMDATKGRDEMITICMFCKRRKVSDFKWVDDDDTDRTELVSHATCPECRVKGCWPELLDYETEQPKGEREG